MPTAIRQHVTVQPGGTAQVTSPRLTPGASAEVIVLVEEANGSDARPRRMGSLTAITGATLYLDANVLIYAAEDAGAFDGRLASVLLELLFSNGSYGHWALTTNSKSSFLLVRLRMASTPTLTNPASSNRAA